MDGGGPDDAHTRPPGTSDTTVEALGKLSEALETVEQLRGSLYALHQNSGRADMQLQDAVELFRKAGHDELAEALDRDLVGRNVLAGRWTFQVVEEYDDGYYATFRELEGVVRTELMAGQRHVYEADMKSQRRSSGRSGHEASP